MQITSRSLYDIARRLGSETIFDPENSGHKLLLSSGFAFLNPVPPHLHDGDNSRRLLLLTPKGDDLLQLGQENGELGEITPTHQSDQAVAAPGAVDPLAQDQASLQSPF